MPGLILPRDVIHVCYQEMALISSSKLHNIFSPTRLHLLHHQLPPSVNNNSWQFFNSRLLVSHLWGLTIWVLKHEQIAHVFRSFTRSQCHWVQSTWSIKVFDYFYLQKLNGRTKFKIKVRSHPKHSYIEQTISPTALNKDSEMSSAVQIYIFVWIYIPFNSA